MNINAKGVPKCAHKKTSKMYPGQKQYGDKIRWYQNCFVTGKENLVICCECGLIARNGKYGLRWFTTSPIINNMERIIDAANEWRECGLPAPYFLIKNLPT